MVLNGIYSRTHPISTVKLNAMNLTIDPNTRKVLINDIEVIDPIIIGQSILDDLKPKQINKEIII